MKFVLLVWLYSFALLALVLLLNWFSPGAFEAVVASIAGLVLAGICFLLAIWTLEKDHKHDSYEEFFEEW